MASKSPAVKVTGGPTIRTGQKAHPSIRGAGKGPGATPHLPAVGGHGPQAR